MTAVRPTVLSLRVAVVATLALLALAIAAPGRASASDGCFDALGAGSEPGFGLAEGCFDQLILDEAGDGYFSAAGHPASIATGFDINATPKLLAPAGVGRYPASPLKDLLTDTPVGVLGNPSVLAQCTAAQLAETQGGSPQCPPESQAGLVDLSVSISDAFVPGGYLTSTGFPLFNMVPPPGAPARFGFNVSGTLVAIDARARTDSDYGISLDSLNVSEGIAIIGSAVTFWGVPADPVHDAARYCPGTDEPGCPTTAQPAAFLRLPTACTEPGVGLETTVAADSWGEPGVFSSLTHLSHDPPGLFTDPELPRTYTPDTWGAERGTEECEEVPFEPQVSVKPTTNEAAAPTGLEVDISVPQEALEDPEAISQADLKDAVVHLPEGMSVNPSSADGLGACSEAQMGLIGAGFPAPNPIHFDDSPAQCPESSKIGTVSIETPLLEDPLEGAVYLAKQNDNPVDSLLAMYLVAEGSGVIVKQVGAVEVDEQGNLTTRFQSAPQTPFSNLHVELKSGPRAPLINPASCGNHKATATLTPWSGNEDAEVSSSFELTQGPSGTPCPSGVFDPRLQAGTAEPLAGAFSPFLLRLTRDDGTRDLTGLEATLPEGLLGKLRGVTYCPESALAAVDGAVGSGGAQVAAPSCPASSQIGTVTAGAGAGPTPFFTDRGRVYLAGPYKGAPYSLAAIFPAVAGPFDLGSVLVRNALRVDPVTTRISVASDPLPTILHGIPLDLRDVRVHVNRPEFTLNPTTCDPMAVEATLSGVGGASAARSSRFQVANCDDLGFKPTLRLRLKGKTRRASNPSLIATLKARPGDANIARARVTLPKSAFLDNSHIRDVCTRVQFDADQCPPGSIYGRASATSPLLDYPVYGPVYLRSSSHRLPDLVVALRGPNSQPIEVDLAGITDSVKGSLRNTFEAVPDAPVDSFHLQLFGGKRGLVELSRNPCKNPERATVLLDGQNGKTYDTHPLVRADCGKGKKKSAGHGAY